MIHGASLLITHGIYDLVHRKSKSFRRASRGSRPNRLFPREHGANRGGVCMTVPVDHVPVGKLPELGVVPKRMHAWVIRRDRQGPPSQAFVKELMDVPEPG